MTSRRLWSAGGAAALVLLPGALVGGCSLVNSFNDVVPLTEGGDSGMSSGDSSVSSDSGAKQDSSISDSGSKADSTMANDAGTDADSGSPGEDSGMMIVDSGAADSTPTGIIVVAAAQLSGDGGFTLTQLDPFTGMELGTRQKTTVFAVRYDGERDLWYVFDDPTNTSGNALPKEVITLHVRSLDTHSGVWTELGSIPVPAILSNDYVTVLNDRLAYVAYTPPVDAGGGGMGMADAGEDGAVVNAGPAPSVFELVLVNTSTPAAPALINPATPISPGARGIIGSRGTGSSVGGNVNIYYVDETNCDDGGPDTTCALTVVRELVPSSGPPDPFLPAPVAGLSVLKIGNPSFGSYLKSGAEDLVGLPSLSAPSDTSLIVPLSPTTHAAGQSVPAGERSLNLSPLAVSECESVVFVAGIPLDTHVYTAPLLSTSPATTSVDLGRAAQKVFFDPYSSSVIAPFDDTKTGTIDAYRYALSTGGGGWALTNRLGTDWNPPTDLVPKVVAVREPVPFPTSDLCTP